MKLEMRSGSILFSNLINLILVLNMLAEATTTELSKVHNPDGFDKSCEIAQRGGKYAGDTRKAIEADTGRPVIASQNATQLNTALPDLITDILNDSDKEL